MMKKAKEDVSGAWYACAGSEQDIVVATRATLSRNLANFPFPDKLNDSESERIQSIVFDAFNFLKNAEDFQAVSVCKLDGIGNKIMHERGILFDSKGKKAGLVLRNDGKISCTVNTDDHLKISSFVPGLGIEVASNSVYEIDNELQKRIQFAASYEFGYLTYSVLNSGSGLSVVVKLHLPACSLLGSINSIVKNISADGFNLLACYGSGGGNALSGFGTKGTSLGSYYIVVPKSSAGGSEFDQIASVQCAVQNILKEERAARKICKAQHITEISNYAFRSLALAKSSFFVPLREAIDIISGVKFGKDMEVFSGIEESELHALLYRVQEGHLEYVLDNGKFKFEKDIQDNRPRKIERLRALILQEAFENIEK
ncbi:hypothetical protein [uncultured Treponema sp.]|uniref:hypothetical protein n=1 Tax=uncultured Treponema sp. TaxID=162155 RepID=UPI000E974BBB|nr:hypothetical protein [uncultured Treponema sp.]HAZ96082.1 hypothetical protein [Treponema sp.]